MTTPGHEDAWKEWHQAISGERLHHAWLLAGRAGLGKSDFAMAAARELVGGGGLALDAAHPDIIVVDRQPRDDKEARKRDDGKPFELRRNIAVDQIRDVQRRLTTRPTLGARRAVIIQPADDLEKAAANALLKSLEEPPQGTFFLLIANSPARLLPTIRSRCRTVRFHARRDEEVAAYLRAHAPEADAAAREAAMIAAHGSPGAALAFLDQDLGPIYRLMQEIVAQGDADMSRRGALGAAMGTRPGRDRIKAVIDLARSVLAARMPHQGKAAIPSLVDAHAALVTLGVQAPTYNFDPGLLLAEIGTLLANAAPHRDRRNV